MTPQQLFEYVRKFTREAEVGRKKVTLPTIRETAKFFKVKQVDIEDACDAYDGEGYMGIAVGVRVGNGYYEFKCRGDCLIEAYT